MEFLRVNKKRLTTVFQGYFIFYFIKLIWSALNVYDIRIYYLMLTF